MVCNGWPATRLAAIAVSLTWLVACESGGFSNDELASANNDRKMQRFANVLAESPVPGGEGEFLLPVLQRQPDCSLTELLLDWDQQKVVRRVPNFQRVLHRRARLKAVTEEFPRGCADRNLGLASQNGVVVGVLANGSYYGALRTFSNSGAITLVVSEGVSAAGSRQDVVVQPPGTQLRPGSLATADLDGDGRDTLIVALAQPSGDLAGGAIALLQPRADGTFRSPTYIMLPFQVFGLSVADFDGDRRLDIAAIGRNPADQNAGLAILRGRSDGGFAQPRLLGAGGGSVVAADFNGDRRLDLATDSGQVLLGEANGSFRSAGPGGWEFGALAAGDFDRDGNADMVVASRDRITIFRAREDGSFVRDNTYAGVYGSQNLAVTDLNGDGHLDLLVGYASKGLYVPHENSGGVLQFLLGRGDGSFVGIPIRAGDIELLADFNRDAKPDLLTFESFGNRLHFFKGRGGVSFAAPTIVTPGLGAVDLASADFNGDGKLDLLAVNGEPGQMSLRLGRGDGSFKPGGDDKPLPFPASAGNRLIALGDFDADRRQDIAVIGAEQNFPAAFSGGLAVLRNTGRGKLGAAVNIDFSLVRPADIAVARVDQGSTTDIVVLDRGDTFVSPPVAGSVRVYRGRGDGSFRAPQVLKPFRHPDALAVADMDKDGLADLLVAGSDSGTGSPELLVVLRGTGTGFRAPLRTTLAEIFITGIATGDIDGDGKLDVALTSCCGLAFNTYLIGKGDGRFQPEALLLVPTSGSRPRLVDINGDGRAEWMMSLPQQGTVVLQNISGSKR